MYHRGLNTNPHTIIPLHSPHFPPMLLHPPTVPPARHPLAHLVQSCQLVPNAKSEQETMNITRSVKSGGFPYTLAPLFGPISKLVLTLTCLTGHVVSHLLWQLIISPTPTFLLLHDHPFQCFLQSLHVQNGGGGGVLVNEGVKAWAPLGQMQ